MIPTTVESLEKKIQEAEAAGVPESRLRDLRDYLAELKSGMFTRKSSTGVMYKETVQGDKRIVQISSAPIISADNDEQ